MKINIHTNISENLKNDEIEVIINSSKPSNEINKIVETIQSISQNIDTIIGIKENNISIINVLDIICFYSKEQSNYCKTKNGEYKIKKKLYELEDSLDKKTFIRISNSCIANVKFIESFDLSKIGDIIVRFSNKTQEYVSKRRIPYVMKFLKERGN